MSAEEPAEAALRDVTVAKSKHLMPPPDRRSSTSRAFETTIPPCRRAVRRHQQVADVFKDPQVKVRGMLRHVPHPSGVDVPQVAGPMRFADAPLQTLAAPPLLGQHSDDILAGLGYASADIAALRSAGVL